MQSEKLIIETSAVEPMMKNGYILVCRETNQAAYIDPGDEVDLLLDWVDQNGVELVSILNTHGHIDHICGNSKVKKMWDVPIHLHREDLFLYDALKEQGQWFGMHYDSAPPVDEKLVAGESLRVGELEIDVLHSPGHSPGSVSLVVEEHVFCGDLIFAGSVGRTDLPGGSMEVLLDSIRRKIFPLGDPFTLLPGHGPATTVGRERINNPFLNGEL